MVSDKRLFEIMIKYHPTFIGWLIKEGKIEKLEDKLVVSNIKHKQPEYIKEYNGRIYETYNSGVLRIRVDSGYGEPNFTEIDTYHGVQNIIEKGFNIFDINNCSARYCLTSQVESLLKKCYDDVYNMVLPRDFPRFKGEVVSYYIKWLEHRNNFLKERNYKFNTNFSAWRYLGLEGYGDTQTKVVENIKKYGIFAYEPIYKEIEWTFDLVEKYKDQLVWKLLMEESNLIWNEDILKRYDKYIPYCLEGQDTYCGKFNENKVLKDYTKLGFLSNDFIENHKDKLDWYNFFKKCKFNWNGEDLKHFCQYALSIDLPHSESFRKTSAASQIKYHITNLIDNKNFQWTSENLYAWLSISENNWQALVEDFHPNIFKLFLAIPNINEIAEPHIKDVKYFWQIVCNKNDFPYDELAQEFTIENIKRNIENWSIPLNYIFECSRRTSSTHEHFYLIETQWDILSKRRNIPLTYELAKYLVGINIKLGGTMCIDISCIPSDWSKIGTYGYPIEEDNRFPIVNALEAFSNHHIVNKEEVIKCIEDKKITDILLRPENAVNIDLIKLITDSFFKDYSINDYIDIVNELKDWDYIREFHGDEK